MAAFCYRLTICIIINDILSIHGDTINPDDTMVQVEVSAKGSLADYSDIIKRPEGKRQPTRHPAAIGIVLKNPRPYPVRYYWWSGTHSVYQGPIGPKSVTATNSYVGHVFYFTQMDRATRQESEFFRIHIVENVNQYILPPEPGMEKDPYYVAAMEEYKFVMDYFDEKGISLQSVK